MNVEHNVDRQLVTWFDEQTTSPPADLLSRTLARVETIGQRPGFLTRDRYVGSALPLGDSPLLVPLVLLLILLLSAAVAVVGSQLVKPSLTVVSPTEGIWQPGDQVAFRARFDSVLRVPSVKWRAGTYSEYGIGGWQRGDVARETILASQIIDVFSREGDTPTTAGRRRVQITITPDGFRDRTILGPNTIEFVDKSVDAVMVGTGRWYTSIETNEAIGPYTVSALIPVGAGGAEDLTERRLRAAGTGYSPEILATYAALPNGALGPASTALLETIRAAVRPGQNPNNPYDLARTMESFLRDPANFAYAVDVRLDREEHCRDVSTVECFAIIRRGYCEYYASTMAVLLRASGIPARVAYGFLPGERGSDGVEVVGAWGAHWWVEVYFPGVGWIEFDPTGGGVGQPQPLPSGPLSASTPPPS